MPPPETDYTLRELARLTQEAMVRMEKLATRLESGQFISAEVFRLTMETLNNRIDVLKDAVETRADESEVLHLKTEVESLKSDRLWLVRLLVAFIVMAILAAAFAASGGISK